MHVEVLELRRRGQHDVGVVGGVGEEHVVHDAEQDPRARNRRTTFADSGATATGFEL